MSVHKEKARLLMQGSRWSMAQKELMESLGENPDDSEAHLMLGECLHQLKQYEKSVEHIREAISLDPDYAHAYYYLGWTYFDRSFNDLNEDELRTWAGKMLEKALSLEPQNPDYLVLLSSVQFNQGLIQPVKKNVEKVLVLHPEHPGALNLQGLLLSRMGEASKAREASQGLLGLQPDNTLSFSNQGWIYWEQGNFKKALESFREAMRLDPQDTNAQNGFYRASLAQNLFLNLCYRYFQFGIWLLRHFWWPLGALTLLITIPASMTAIYPHWAVGMEKYIRIFVPVLAGFVGVYFLNIFFLLAVESLAKSKNPLKSPAFFWALGSAGGLGFYVAAKITGHEGYLGGTFLLIFAMLVWAGVYKRPKGLPQTKSAKITEWIILGAFLLMGLGAVLGTEGAGAYLIFGALALMLGGVVVGLVVQKRKKSL